MKRYGRRWIIIGLIVLVVCVWVFRYFSSDEVVTQVARMTEFEDKIKVSAVFVRDEMVYRTQNGGLLLGRVRNGAKVSANSHIATLYQGGLDESAKKEIEEINSRIEMLDELSSMNANFSADINSIEEDIKKGVGQIVSLSLKEDLTNLDVATINLEEVMNVGNGGVINTTVEELDARRSEIESTITASSEKIYSNESGIFIPFADGYEDVFKAEEYDAITIDAINNCIKEAKNVKSNEVLEYNSGDSVCKVVNNTSWLLACEIKKEDIYGLKKGKTVRVRIADGTNAEANGTIIKLFSEDDKSFICVLEVGDAIKNAYSNRVSEIEIIKESYNGLSIPSQALRFSEDNVAGVYVNSGGLVRFREVNILYSDENVAIVENTNTSGMIRMYDSVILDRDGIYEGKTVK